jgi:HSP20 family protein
MNTFLKIYEPFLLDSFFDWGPNTKKTSIGPKSDWNKETGNHQIWIETPGFSEEEISIELEGDKLTISGELKNEEIIKKIGSKNFSYYMHKKNLDPESIKATLKDGILEVGFKTEKPKQLKKVEVKMLN